MPVGMIVGEFKIEKYISGKPDKIWDITSEKSGITEEFFREYFDGYELAHAIKVKSVKRYKKARSIDTMLPSSVAPQSFCYVD